MIINYFCCTINPTQWREGAILGKTQETGFDSRKERFFVLRFFSKNKETFGLAMSTLAEQQQKTSKEELGESDEDEDVYDGHQEEHSYGREESFEIKRESAVVNCKLKTLEGGLFLFCFLFFSLFFTHSSRIEKYDKVKREKLSLEHRHQKEICSLNRLHSLCIEEKHHLQHNFTLDQVKKQKEKERGRVQIITSLAG